MWIDDQILTQCHNPLNSKIWVPENKTVVLGRSNRAEVEVDQEACQLDEVEVLKRYGGGGTVLLYPGCIVVSIGAWVKNPFANDKYFRLLNQSIINSISSIYPLATFSQRGFSDIVWQDRKWAGTSLFRSRSYLLYQASIIYELSISDIDLYLRHPSKEPDYRRGRSHKDFLIGLKDIDPSVSFQKIRECMSQNLANELSILLADELIEPNSDHIPYLLERAAKG